MKFKVLAFGLSCGLVWGLGLFCLTWWIMAFDGATGGIPFIGHIYRGYSISPAGSLIGLAWALADGFAGGVIFALVYNWFAARLSA